ncbi:hypothetical protein BCR35DRAFT_351964 [Leucosporidium creatinivorum]|uniref:P-loop containing nucleoside triphosphate hydrolase protein n=1 Tax=Leucosporidium creatinivorum TaxID=106004 RepID=A0A1Y2FJD0_9BASI|nr:hypothetical protein BCR35DRAFT_351964 [Leucosporidium creatinivorum]
MASIPTDPADLELLSTLASLRLALPATLLGVLLLRFAAKAFTGIVAHIQAGGWTDDGSNPLYDALPTTTDEDEIHPVVVKVKKTRRGLVLSLFWLVGATFVGDGIAQIIYTLITNVFTPSQPLWQNIIAYSLGGLSSFALCAIAMTWEERSKQEEASWGAVYPRVVAVVGCGLDIAIAVVLALLIKQNSANQPSTTPLPAIHLAIVSVRLLCLVFLILSQTPLLYKSYFVPWSTLHPGSVPAATENTSLLNGNGQAPSPTYGTEAGPSTTKKRSILRASQPPSNRPPDPKSLSILTLFSRVRTLFPYLWPSKSVSLQILALICVGLMLLKRFVNVWVPILFGKIISDLSAGRSPYRSIVLYSIASFARDSNSMLYRYLWLPIEQYSEREMNSLSFDCLLNLSLSYHTRRKTGELLRILSRSDAINNFFETLIFTFIPVIIDLPVAAVVLGVRYGALIVSIVMVVSVIFVTTSIILAESRTKLYRSLRDESQFMHQIKTDVLFNFETVKVFTSEAFESERLRNAMRIYQRGYFKVYSAWNSLSLIQTSISSFGFLACSFVLAQRVVAGNMEVGDYVTFVNYLNQIYTPLNQVASLYRDTMRNLVDTEQLADLLNEEKDIVDRPDSKELVVAEGAKIEFDNVKFSYDGKKDIIKGISFSIEPGQSVALVGPSGGGKSTIMRLLYRFYDVTEGSIKVNGLDIRDASQTSLRRAIGLVPQESVLFNETVRFNIAYAAAHNGGVNLTEEAIIEAAKSAAIHDKIMTFPAQYETRVGERGQRLSGGEKQRVAIARVILKNPPVLLLDEATSALDTTNERAIQARLRELSQGRTTLAIAHRLSTIVDSDIIHCLDEGEIVESGSHSELLAKGGVYAELWQKQIEGQEGGLASGAATPKTGVETPQTGASTPVE